MKILSVSASLLVALAMFSPEPHALQGGFSLVVSCGGKVEGDLDDCESATAGNWQAALTKAVGKAIAGGAQLRCRGCPPEYAGCAASIGGTSYGVSFEDAGGGNVTATLCPESENSTVYFQCSDCH